MTNVNSLVMERFNFIEVEKNVKVLYAAESGSRIWGYANKDSDYDVRFIYCRSSQDYLKIKRFAKVIEDKPMTKIEMVGWDLYKAMDLFLKSNPSLFECLFSSIVYKEYSPFIEQLRKIAKACYSHQALGYHYLRLAKSNIHKNTMNLKIYFQIIRSLLIIRWLNKYKILPPLSIQQLIVHLELDKTISETICYLLELKRSNYQDIDYSEHVDTLDIFINQEIRFAERIVHNLRSTKIDSDLVDNLILDVHEDYPFKNLG